MAPDDDVVMGPIGMSSVDVVLYQLLETELVRAEVYRTALRCTAGDPRAAMFEAPLEEAELHVAIAVEKLLDGMLQGLEITNHVVGVQHVSGQHDFHHAAVAMRKAAFVRMLGQDVSTLDFEGFADAKRHD